MCVLGLSSDQENRLLISGDTAGFVQVWDISQFALEAVDQVSKRTIKHLLNDVHQIS